MREFRDQDHPQLDITMIVGLISHTGNCCHIITLLLERGPIDHASARNVSARVAYPAQRHDKQRFWVTRRRI